MWQDHYQSLLNSVKSLEHKTSVTSTLSSIENESIEIRPLDIVNALKSVNKGKACGVDGLAAEHFIYADHVILSILFNCFISHGYLPSEFMKTAIVPIIKNKTGDTSDKNIYRSIALVTACSKISELCILSIIENYICTHDHQFGFKKQHATDMCIYTVKSVIKYYTRQNSPIYIYMFLDASKAFDRISHWTLFKKLIACHTPVLIVRILMFWYQKQSICVKWGKRTSEYFSIINGVRQGGVLSPKLFAIDLSVCLTQCKAGCHLNETVTNHVVYADDICLMAPSAIALQKMLNRGYDFSQSNDIILNPITCKSQCMVFKPNRFKLYCPAVYLTGNIIDYVKKTKYLGYTCMFTNDKQDEVEMLIQLRLLYMRSNKIIRMFHFCTIDGKLELFRSFCTSFYCCYLWTGYKNSTFNRLRTAFNNAYRRNLDLP